jgi:hypothetical protein
MAGVEPGAQAVLRKDDIRQEPFWSHDPVVSNYPFDFYISKILK